MLFGIAIGTVSSIMIAAPILLLLGEHRLRRDVTTLPVKPQVPAGAAR
jgi:preprotein translocase subunit SecD/preprotein translocase subunit SecF